MVAVYTTTPSQQDWYLAAVQVARDILCVTAIVKMTHLWCPAPVQALNGRLWLEVHFGKPILGIHCGNVTVILRHSALQVCVSTTLTQAGSISGLLAAKASRPIWRTLIRPDHRQFTILRHLQRLIWRLAVLLSGLCGGLHLRTYAA